MTWQSTVHLISLISERMSLIASKSSIDILAWISTTLPSNLGVSIGLILSTVV